MSAGRLTAVALCDRLAAPDDRAELTALAESLERALPDVRAAVVPGLSAASERGPSFAAGAGADRLLLGMGANGVSVHEVQREARRVGLDPFAVELVRIPAGSGASASASLRLRAAAAGLRASPDSEPEQLRPRLVPEERAVSRRALLTLPPLAYEPVPGVAGDRCADPERCGLCVDACPAGALAAEAGRILVDTRRCGGCGRCVSACPAGAVGLPGSSLARYEAEIGVLLTAERPALLFCCRRADAALDGAAAGWLPVEVPSLGAATPGWALQALAGGAVAVGFCSCGDDGHCPETLTETRVAYLRDLLRLLGDAHAATRVQLASGRPGPLLPAPAPAGLCPGGSGRVLRLSEPAATAEALLGLAGAGGGASLVDAASPLGVVDLRAEACTLCGACAGTCPTGALRLDEGADGAALSYDAAACAGCARCTATCPEEAIEVERATDVESLTRGRTVLKAGSLARCMSCGAAIAPQPLLDRLRELLAGDEHLEPLFRILGDRCGGCRGSALTPSRLVKGEQWK